MRALFLSLWLSSLLCHFTDVTAFMPQTGPANRPSLHMAAKSDPNLGPSLGEVTMMKSKMFPVVFGTLFSYFLSFPSPSITDAHSPLGFTGKQQERSQLVQVVNAADKISGNLEGTQAPLFSLPGSTGTSVSLKDLTESGKYTVLYFYPGDFTSGCTLEANAFQKNLDAIKALNAQVVGVSVDPVDKHVEFRKSCGLDFVLLSDEGGKVSEAYGTALDIPFLGKFSNRQTYLISPTGVVEKVFTNLNGKVSKHPEEVIAALEELKK